MLAANIITLVNHAEQFSHEEACRICQEAMGQPSQLVVVDLKCAAAASTAAFARLILLRRALLQAGRDLCVCGLHDAVSGLYQINRLQGVLPVQCPNATQGN